MDRELLQRHLRYGERFVAVGRQHVARQCKLVAELESAGRDATTARALVEAYRVMLERHESICARIREELADSAVGPYGDAEDNERLLH